MIVPGMYFLHSPVVPMISPTHPQRHQKYDDNRDQPGEMKQLYGMTSISRPIRRKSKALSLSSIRFQKLSRCSREWFRTWPRAAVVSDEYSGDDDGNRARRTDGVSDGVSAHRQSEGHQHFILIIVHPSGSGWKSRNRWSNPIPAPPPASRRRRSSAWSMWGFPAGHDPENGQKDGDADAVVEKRFAGHGGFEAFGAPTFFMYSEDGDRICRRNQGTEHEAQIIGTGKPIHPKTSTEYATNAVETEVPSVARRAIDFHSRGGR